MPRDPFPVAADLTRTPSAAPAPGRVEIDDRAVVPLALTQTRARLGVGEQLHGVPGDRAEQRRAVGRSVQLPYERAVRGADGAGGRGRRAGEVVEAGQGLLQGTGVGDRGLCTSWPVNLPIRDRSSPNRVTQEPSA